MVGENVKGIILDNLLKIPAYFVRKVSGYPAGIRMPKMVPFLQGGYSNFKPYIPPLFGKGDPLGGGDYRYWCGLSPTARVNKGYASCRGCGEVFITKDGRKAHKSQGCGVKLEEAYKLLRRTTKCMICQLDTHRKVYGLPMCCKDCEFEWEYVTTTPMTLRYVLEEVGS